MRTLAILALASLAALAIAQPRPVPVEKAALPKEGVCHYHPGAPRPVVAGVQFQGKTYLFCTSEELAKFLENPQAEAAGQNRDNVRPVQVPT